MDYESQKITFDEDEWNRPARTLSTQKHKIVQWVITNSRGIIQNETQANYVLAIITVIALIASIFISFSGNRVATHLPSPTELEQMHQTLK